MISEAFPKRILGSGTAAMTVSAIGFGAMGTTYHRGAAPEKKSLLSLFARAVELGCTFFDTAAVYGPFTNELLVGEALEPFRNHVQIATKFGHCIHADGSHQSGELDSSPAAIRRSCEASLKRLRSETIDLFYQHRFDPKVPIEEVAGVVADLIREGKVQHFGLCEVSPEIICRAHAVCPLTAVQNEYHLMWRIPEDTLFPTLNKLGIGLVPYSPLNRGMLGGEITHNTKFAAKNDNRAALPRFLEPNLSGNLKLVDVLERFGRPRGLRASQTALAWLLAKAPSIVPIPGTTKQTHLEENLAAAQRSLNSLEVSELEAAAAEVPILGDRYPTLEKSQVWAA